MLFWSLDQLFFTATILIIEKMNKKLSKNNQNLLKTNQERKIRDKKSVNNASHYHLTRRIMEWGDCSKVIGLLKNTFTILISDDWTVNLKTVCSQSLNLHFH